MDYQRLHDDPRPAGRPALTKGAGRPGSDAACSRAQLAQTACLRLIKHHQCLIWSPRTGKRKSGNNLLGVRQRDLPTESVGGRDLRPCTLDLFSVLTYASYCRVLCLDLSEHGIWMYIV